MARIAPTYSPRIGSEPDESKDNRKTRRARQRHHGVFTTASVWRNVNVLNEDGLLIRSTRIARRRGKSERWIKERVRTEQHKRRLFRDAINRLMMMQHDHSHDHEGEEEHERGTDTGTTTES